MCKQFFIWRSLLRQKKQGISLKTVITHAKHKKHRKPGQFKCNAVFKHHVGGGGGGGGRFVGKGGGGGVACALEGKGGAWCVDFSVMFIGLCGGNFCTLCGPGGDEKSSDRFFFVLSVSLGRSFDGTPDAGISGLGFMNDDDGRLWRSLPDFLASKGEPLCLCDVGNLLPLEWEFVWLLVEWPWRLLELWWGWVELLPWAELLELRCAWELLVELLFIGGLGNFWWKPGVEWKLGLEGRCELLGLDWDGGRFEEEGSFDWELWDELEWTVFSFLEGVNDSSCSRCLCLLPETTLLLSLLPLKLLVLPAILTWFSWVVELDEPEGFAYFVVSGSNGGNMTVVVGVSTTAALLVIVNVALLFFFLEICSLICFIDASMPPDDSLFVEWSLFNDSLFDGSPLEEYSPFDEDSSLEVDALPFVGATFLLNFSPAVLGRWPP